MNEETPAWYCYAVTRDLPAGAVDGVRGLEDAPVQTITAGDLTAVAGPVPRGQYDETALRAKLEDLAWLEGVARRHNDVVGEVARCGVTLPFRLATLYLDRQRVRAVLRDGHARISAALDRVEGRVEWGVKVHAEPSKPATLSASDDRSGRSYLRKRLTERRSRDEAWRSTRQAADEIDRALSELAEDRCAHRPQSAELSGEPGVNVLNVAYLVPEAQSDRFLARAEELRAAARGCRVEVTGPWVPYSFGLPELTAGRDAPA